MMPATRNVPLFVFIFGHGMLDFRVEIGENTNGHVDFMEFARFREAATYCYICTLVVGPYTPNSMLRTCPPEVGVPW
jgi:hypothetical protein